MAIIHVIIPCYNVEKYLEQAVSSVLDQPFKGIDIVLVDDGATDSSPTICDRLSREYGNISVIHKGNGGVSSARNTGIEYVLNLPQSDHQGGRYLAFLDADDTWEQGFLNEYVLELLDGRYDLVGFQSCNCNPQMVKTDIPGELREGEFSGGAQNVWLHSSQSFAAMFYSRELLGKYNIRFREGLKYSEDKIFSLQCMYLAGRIYQENRSMYLYRIFGSSAMGRREFGIPYYGPIVEAYLEMDRNMENWASPERGVLTVGHLCASHYIVYMMQEHFQSWGSKKAMDWLLEAHPEYVAIMKRKPPYQSLPQNPEYEKYEQNPDKYILKQKLMGIGLWMKRCAAKIVKCFR